MICCAVLIVFVIVKPAGTYNFLPAADVTVEDPAPAAATPEPASLLLFGTGLIGLALVLHKRSRQRQAGRRTAQTVRNSLRQRSLTLPQGLAAQRS
ncbi:MAG: PEP-CTERM sorting domain-containing protein [Terriglobia bacterium]